MNNGHTLRVSHTTQPPTPGEPYLILLLEKGENPPFWAVLSVRYPENEGDEQTVHTTDYYEYCPKQRKNRPHWDQTTIPGKVLHDFLSIPECVIAMNPRTTVAQLFLRVHAPELIQGIQHILDGEGE
jgi:hypothetical protein